MPDPIQGQLPFGGMTAPILQGGAAGLAKFYADTHAGALGMQEANYNNIIRGYQQTMASQTSQQDAIRQGYANLAQSVLGGISNVGQGQAQAIEDAYAKQSGSATQGLIDRGLGNTTVQNSVQRGLQLDKSKAQVALADQIAQLRAGYETNLGGMAQNYNNQANAQNTALASQQLGWMNSVNTGYPDARLYAQLAQQYGAAQQAGSDRQRADAAIAAMQGGGGGGPGVGSYVPANSGPMQTGSRFGSAGGAGAGGTAGGYSQLAVDQARANALANQRPPNESGAGGGDWMEGMPVNQWGAPLAGSGLPGGSGAGGGDWMAGGGAAPFGDVGGLVDYFGQGPPAPAFEYGAGAFMSNYDSGGGY